MGLHFCYECWYFNNGKCDAKRKNVEASDFACTEFANVNDED